VPLQLPVRPDEIWTMDFTQDAFATGRCFRTLNLMDGFTRDTVLNPEFVMLSIGFIGLEALLFITAVDAYKKYVERGTTIVGGDEVANAAKA
jgi:hypothetical protein